MGLKELVCKSFPWLWFCRKKKRIPPKKPVPRPPREPVLPPKPPRPPEPPKPAREGGA